MKYVEIKNLSKTFESLHIDFSMEADEGTMNCIVGPSGSGKSTVLKMISGLLDCDEADGEKPSVILDGQEIINLKPQKRNVGMVFQTPSLFLNMNVIQNLAYGLRSHGWSKKEAYDEAEKMLEILGMKDFGKRTVDSLSGGEAQRVCLGRTLLVKPKLILFDEPFSALDAPLRKKLGEDILEMQEKFHFTSIMVTHDLEEAKRLSKRIMVMKKGKIIFDDTSDLFDEALLSD